MFLTYKREMIFFVFIIFFIILDRFFKTLAMNFLAVPFNLLGNFFSFSFSGNYNIAFSLPITGIFLNFIIILIILGLVYNLLYNYKTGKKPDAFLLLMVIMGAISNLVDRLKYGFVIDYFDLKYFTVFNLADMMIVLGAAGLAYRVFVNKKQLR